LDNFYNIKVIVEQWLNFNERIRKMRKYFLTSFIPQLLVFSFMVYPVFAGDSSAKKGCDAISPSEIQDILKKINANNAKILSVKKSPLAGICEVDLEREGQLAIFYFDIPKTHLFFGNLVEMKTMTNLTAQSFRELQDIKRIDVSKISLTAALVLGDLKAEKKVIIFTDPDCPYCADLHKVIKQISEKRKDIAFYIKMYPLAMHKDAYWKSKSIVCNNSLQLLQDCFDKKVIAKTDCQTQEVDDTLKLVNSLGISGTPAIILPDGRIRVSAMPEAELIKFIDGKI
jgi:thiol:disulfide interchange protein DsbC